MKLIAHRGYRTKYIKENTMEAFKNALNNGFEGIECDVRRTKDGKLVICHDAFIDRTSNGRGLISEMTYRELLKYNFGTKECPSKIPLLSDVLKNIKALKLIELKCRIDFESIIPYIDENTYFISFDTSYILELKEKYQEFHFGILNYVLNSHNPYNLDIICLLDDTMTKNLEHYFQNRHIGIFLYGIRGKIHYNSQNIYYIVDDKKAINTKGC